MENKSADARPVRFTYEILFSLNIGVALGLAACFFLRWRSMTSPNPGSDLFWRTVMIFDHFMVRLIYGPKFSMYQNLPMGGYEIVMTTMSLVFSLIILMVVRVVPHVRARSVLLRYVGGTTALAGVLLVWLIRPAWEFGPYPTWTPGASEGFALELAVIVGALYLTRALPAVGWCAILLLHYAIMAWYVWENWWGGSFYWNGLASLLFRAWPVLLSLVGPASGLAWALYFRNSDKSE